MRRPKVRQGPTEATTSSTSRSRLRNTTSSGKRMNQVCMEHAGVISSPSPDGRLERPSRPFIRAGARSAIAQASHTVVPLSLITMRVAWLPIADHYQRTSR